MHRPIHTNGMQHSGGVGAARDLPLEQSDSKQAWRSAEPPSKLGSGVLIKDEKGPVY